MNMTVTSFYKILPLWMFLLINQSTNPLIYILAFAVIINFALNEAVEAVAILTVVILNMFLGIYQEYKAQNTLDSLKQ